MKKLISLILTTLLLIACLAHAGQEQGIDPMAVYTDRQLLSLTGLI